MNDYFFEKVLERIKKENIDISQMDISFFTKEQQKQFFVQKDEYQVLVSQIKKEKSISFLSEEQKRIDFLKLLLKINVSILKFFPENILTSKEGWKMCFDMVKEKPIVIKHIPKNVFIKKFDSDMIQIILDNTYILRFISKDIFLHHTYILFSIAKKLRNDILIPHIPKELFFQKEHKQKMEEIVLSAVKRTNNLFFLYYIPKEFLMGNFGEKIYNCIVEKLKYDKKYKYNYSYEDRINYLRSLRFFSKENLHSFSIELFIQSLKDPTMVHYFIDKLVGHPKEKKIYEEIFQHHIKYLRKIPKDILLTYLKNPSWENLIYKNCLNYVCQYPCGIAVIPEEIFFQSPEKGYEICLETITCKNFKLYPTAVIHFPKTFIETLGEKIWKLVSLAVFNNIESLKMIPKKYFLENIEKTWNLLLKISEKTDFPIHYIPLEILLGNMENTILLSINILSKNINWYETIPKEILKQPEIDKIYLPIVKKKPSFFSQIPKQFLLSSNLGIEIVKEAVSKIGSYLQLVPMEILLSEEGKEICLLAVSNDGYQIKWILNNKKLKTYVEQNKEIFYIQAVKSAPEILMSIANDLSNVSNAYEICLEAVKRDGQIFEYVPLELFQNNQIYSLCLEALHSYPYIIKYMKEKNILFTQYEFYELCVTTSCFEYIPFPILKQYPQLIFKAIETLDYYDYHNKYYHILSYLPSDLQTLDICIAAVRKTPANLVYVKKEFMIDTVNFLAKENEK